MANYQGTQRRAQTKQDKSLFLVGMLWIVDKESVFVGKYCLRFLEGYSMLAFVNTVLYPIPLKAYPRHFGQCTNELVSMPP